MEVGEHRALGDAQALGDLGGRGPLIAELGEYLAADAQDVPDALFRLGARRHTAGRCDVFHLD
ncbi:hypothetical protein D9M72_382490 [compost metagenome]